MSLHKPLKLNKFEFLSRTRDLVEYEFVHYDFYDGDLHGDRETLVKGLDVRNYSLVQGVVLFQLIDERRLKVELLPGMEASEVDGFTANARIYVR